MMQNLLHPDLPVFNLVVRALVVYLVLLLLLRISGKRQLGQMGATELVSILLVSNAVQNSMNGGDNSLVGGLLLATVLISLSTLISFLTYRSPFFSRVFEGTPTLVVHKGKLIEKHLARERLTENEFKTLLRKHGIHHLSEVETAVLEADGSLSITKLENVNERGETLGR